MAERAEEVRRQPLSRARVVEAALALVDREGLEALSMRRVAADLGVEAMSLYRYAPNKEDLLDGMVELMLGQLAGQLEGADWTAQFRSYGRAFRRTALAHPHAFPLVITRLLAVPLCRRPLGVLALVERMLEVLCQGGFSDAGAWSAYRRVVGYLMGQLAMELREVVDDPEEPEMLLRLGLHRLSARQFPRLRALGPALLAHDAEREFNDGLDALLAELDPKGDTGRP